MEFEYAKYQTRAGTIYRPAINILFTYKSRRFPYKDALVDTGSDFILLPISIAEILGVEPDLETISEINCACGHSFKSYESKYPLDLIVDRKGFMPKKWPTHVQFVDAEITPLLGFRGFLDKFDATFFSSRHVLRLEPKR